MKPNRYGSNQTLAFAGATVTSLKDREQIEVLKAWDLDLALEMELRRRIKTVSEAVESRIQPNDIAYISAFPLKRFITEAFPIVEKGREYKDNWHIDIICELLQSVVTGQVRNFIINIPRRCSKSTLVCVMFPCWVWTFLPHLRFLFTSYSAEFAKRDNEKCQDLIKSAYYQQKWGDRFMLTIERRGKIENTKGGAREVFRIGKGTGTGADYVLGDDINAIDEVESDVILDKTNRGWNEVSYHNVSDRNTAVRGFIAQRTAFNDITGNITEDPDLAPLYEVLCLAMKYESDNPLAKTPKTPLNLGKVSQFERSNALGVDLGEDKLWVDPRDLLAPTFPNKWYRHWHKTQFQDKGLESKGDGQLLWESYITEDIIKKELVHLKAYGEAAQYQQRPIRRGGNFFNSADFGIVSLKSVDFQQMKFVRFWDKAGSLSEGDWTVGMLVGRTIKRPYELYIIDIIREQVGYYERMKRMKDAAFTDTRDFIEKLSESEYTVMIEGEMGSAGKDLTVIEKDFLLGYDVRIDKPRGKKWIRAQPVKNASESGRVKVVRSPWNAAFFRELERYQPPAYNAAKGSYNADHNQDDQIDCLSGAFKFLIFGETRQQVPFSGVR